MHPILNLLPVIPLAPLVAAAMIAGLPNARRRTAAALAIGAQVVALALSVAAFVAVLRAPVAAGETWRATLNFHWLEVGAFSLPLGLVLDPLTAAMLVMVTLVSLLVFVFSLGYMATDPRFSRFFGFLSLFSAGMLGLVVANSLLLLFACWEIVGLASYLLIGFWFDRPAAADAARKAFITTRIGDLGLFLGMLWLHASTGTLLFYDGGSGCLESAALAPLAQATVIGGLTVSAAISLLIFCGAAGKSGQFPLHVWLPDAMEGPTPVSALIHAATMVAAGVFLVARAFPLFVIAPAALTVVTWIGAVTALGAAAIAVAQSDLKRVLAFSTVSQLGVMMVALGVGAWPVAIAHLIAHAFFKALLFLGAGSVIHAAHHEQDIRRLGGLRRAMPVTFACYAVGMMALAGAPFFFTGFWTKEAVFHAAAHYGHSQGPFAMVVASAFLTAFYMTRQTVLVFFGSWRGAAEKIPHESPRVMTLPLIVLASAAVVPVLFLTPAWPWFHHFLTGEALAFAPAHLLASPGLLVLSVVIVAAGLGAGWQLYGRRAPADDAAPDVLETRVPGLFRALAARLGLDEFYNATVLRATALAGRASAGADRWLWGGLVAFVALLARGFARLFGGTDRAVIDGGFDRGCGSLHAVGRTIARWQAGRGQVYLRAVGLGTVILLLYLAWMR